MEASHQDGVIDAAAPSADAHAAAVADAQPVVREVLMSFVAWMTTGDEVHGPFSKYHDAAPAAVAVERYLASDEFSEIVRHHRADNQ